MFVYSGHALSLLFSLSVLAEAWHNFDFLSIPASTTANITNARIFLVN